MQGDFALPNVFCDVDIRCKNEEELKKHAQKSKHNSGFREYPPLQPIAKVA